MDTAFTCTEMVHGLDYSGHSDYNTLTERERAREMSPQYALCLTSAGKFLCWSATTVCLLNFVMCVTAQGSFVLVYQEEESSFTEQGVAIAIPPLHLVMVGWQGAKSTRAYIPVSDCVHYLRLCGADVSKYGKWYSSSSKKGGMYYMQ
jgi:hypothetical protein